MKRFSFRLGRIEVVTGHFDLLTDQHDTDVRTIIWAMVPVNCAVIRLSICSELGVPNGSRPARKRTTSC